MRKLLILTLALTFAIASWAQDVSEKYSVSTQMFLRELNSGSNFQPVKRPLMRKHKMLNGRIAPSAPLTTDFRTIVAPDTINGIVYVSAYITLDNSDNTAGLESLGVIVQSRFNSGITICLIPVDKISEVSELAEVKRVTVGTLKRQMTNIGRINTNVDDILTRSADAVSAGLPTTYDGTGVLVGVIDTGIDFQHIAFKDKNGNSRIKRAYVYNGSTEGEYTSITSSSPTTDDNTGDHGTHTSSTAGGSSVIVNGTNVTVTDNHSSASYGGMAPGADLYLAGVKDLADTYLDKAVNNIINYADANNMPVVVSNSWGSGVGPRDGTGETATIYNELFGDEHPNRVALFAASNDADAGSSENGGFHIQKSGVSSSNPLGTILRSQYYSDTDKGFMYASLLAAAWSRSNSKVCCKIHVLDSSTGAIKTTKTVTSYGTVDLSGYYSGNITAYIGTDSGKGYCQLVSENGTESESYDSNYNSDYTLAVEFYPYNGSATIDAWGGTYSYFANLNLSTSGHTWINGDNNVSVSDEATIENVISIGAHVTRTSWKASNGTTYGYPAGTQNALGDIANFSSYATAAESPTGLRYPWITAPGAMIISGVNHYHTDENSYYDSDKAAELVVNSTTNPYGAMNGTSMATPTAAGIVALWLQVAKENNVELTTNDIKTIMAETAIKDSYVTSGANASHFGNGKIDALAGIQYILDNYVQEPAVAAPALDKAGSVGTDQFTASWSAVEGADSYTLEIGKAAAEPTTVDDLLTRATTGVTGTQYSSWSGKTGASGAVYAGQSAGGNESIQLRSSNSNSGIISTTSGGKIKKVTVTWNSNTSNGNKLDVYGSNTVYTSPTQLYGNSIVGTKLGSITKGTSTELEITGDYAYIGVRSSSGALYLTDITFTWDKSSTTSSGAPRLRAVSDVTDGDVRTISGITGTSHVVTGLDAGATYKFKVKAVSGTDESRWSNEETVTLASGPGMLVEPEELEMTAVVGETATATVDVVGYYLTANATVSVGGTNASLFSVSPATMTPTNGEIDEKITVTYTPTAVGNHSATLTIASEGAESVDIPITGTATAPALVVYNPVMTTATDEQVGITEFTATWTDETDATNVESYTLYVNKYVAPTTQEVDDVLNRATTGVTGTSYSGWSGKTDNSGAVYAGQSAGGNESIQLRDTSPSGIITTTSPGKVKKVKVTWNSNTQSGRTLNVYGKNSAYSAATDLYNTSNQGTLLGTIVNGTSTELTIDGDYEYVGVRSNSGAMYLTNITFTWEVPASLSSAPRLRATETGDASTRTISGIDANTKQYTVQNLTAGAVYDYYVEANYSNGESASSNTERVTLKSAPTPELVADETLTFEAAVNATATKTLNVLGSDLTGDVTLTLTDASGYYSLSSSTISKAAAEESADITVTYAPTAAGTHNATITISSDGAEDVTVALTGTATGPTLEADPTSLSFEAFVNDDEQKTVALSGENLTGDVTLAISGDNASMFTVSDDSFTPDAGGDVSETVTITYAPTAVGTHTATLTISSAGATSAEVALSGSAVLKKAVPEMLPAVTETEVGDTWFDATWTDATPVANVSSYTLYVNKVEETPEPQTGVWLAQEDFSNFTGATNGTQIGTSTNPFDNVMATAGWTGTTVYSYNGALRIGSNKGSGSLESPYFDLTDYETVTVKVQVSKNNSATNKSLTINLCDGNNNDNVVDTKSQALTQVQVTATDFATAVPEYSFTLDCSTLTTKAYISFSVESSTQANFRYINIYAGSEPSSGAPRLKAVVEDGDASTRTITGISGDTKKYRVSGLTPGAKYDYKVKAVYVDEGESDWSNVEQVTLKTLTPHTLAEMVADGTLGVGDSYAIADGNLLAVALSADGKTLFCKDANGYAQKQSASGSQVDYMVEYGFETPLEYDQSNWVALTSESALSGDLVGSYLTGVSGTVSDLANPSLALAAAPAVGESGSAYLAGTPNRFIPTSFLGESVIESGGKVFFFVAPKPVEVAIVTWACWNGSKFVSVPKTTYTKEGVTSTMNPYNLQGEFTVDTKYLENWPTLTEDEVYEFTAVITREGGASPAPGRLKSATSAGGYGIYPLSAPTSIGSVGGTVTGITGVNGNGAAVESVTIYNSVGVRQSELQRGVNIIVTRYTDGTTRTVKILK